MIRNDETGLPQNCGATTSTSGSRKKARCETKESGESLFIAISGAEIGFWNYVPKFNRVTWDAMAERHFGVAASESNLPLEGWLALIHPDDHRAFMHGIDELLHNGVNFRTCVRIPSDTLPMRHLQLSGSVFTNAETGLKTVTGVVWNVSEQMAQKELDEALATELRRSNQELQDFARIASHDLQEPLRKIRSFGERLNKGAGHLIDEKHRDYLRRMTGAADRMSHLIEDLLVFSRVRTQAEAFQNVDLNEVVAVALEILDERISQMDARIESDTLPTITADQTQMVQLFQNIIGNGLKYRKPDTPPIISITVSNQSKEPNPDNIEIVIRDNGIGFNNIYADKIFEVFQRLHGISAYEGTGVGLSVCKKIVERHRGSISAKGEEGRGAAFMIRLPVQQSTDITDYGKIE